ESRPDNLQADRQSVAVEAARNRARRQIGMVEDRCEYRVPARSRRTPLELGWAEPRERPGRARHGRRDEKIILTKEPVEPAIKLVAEQHRTGHLRPGCREPGFDLHGDVGIDVPGILAV